MNSLADSYVLEVDEEVLLDRGREDLESSIRVGIAELLERAPSDCLVTVHLSKQTDEGFRADVHIVSTILEIRTDAVAHSPFVAFERAMIQARDQVLVWSEQKRL